MLNIHSIQHQSRPAVRAKTCDPITQILVWITFRLVNLAQKLLRPLNLLEPPFPRRSTASAGPLTASPRDGGTPFPSFLSPTSPAGYLSCLFPFAKTHSSPYTLEVCPYPATNNIGLDSTRFSRLHTRFHERVRCFKSFYCSLFRRRPFRRQAPLKLASAAGTHLPGHHPLAFSPYHLYALPLTFDRSKL